MSWKQIRSGMVFAVVAVALFPGLAAADITSLAVTPNPANAGYPVTVTVDATPDCSQVHIEFGDGQRTDLSSSQGWPQSVQHTYALPAGTKTITASGVAPSTCAPKSATLTVVQGSGQIQGLTVPAQAKENEQLTITLNGIGFCDQVDLDYGDGQPHGVPSNFVFPYTFLHTYRQRGTVTLKATGGGRCQGQATATLMIGEGDLIAIPGTPTRLDPPLSRLCQIVDCTGSPPPPVPSTPLITEVRGTVTPGGRIVVIGSGFGTKPGKLYISGIFGGTVWRELEDLSWQDNLVEATVPEITGVPDRSATLQLVRGDRYLMSNQMSVSFTAAREIMTLPMDAVQVVSCSNADWRNTCNVPIARYESFGPLSIEGGHSGWFFGARGSDAYSVALKNGWVFDHMWKGVTGFLGSASDPKGFAPGTASAALVVEWEYGFMGDVVYLTDIVVRGPKGVPYQ